MESNSTKLRLHHDSILAWREEGLDFRQIATRLSLEGVKVDHNVVYRYCKKAGIPTNQPPKPPSSCVSSTEVETSEIPPVVREPWQAPPRLFSPLDSGAWWTPDLPLLQFGQEENPDSWTLQDACEGVFITGATGSGKTSGSGAALARSFLEFGFGGIVLTVKPEERQLWERYAAACKSSNQLCIVEQNGSYHFNFLDYEARRPGAGSGMIDNLVNLFYTALEVHARSQGEHQAKFWENAGKQLLRNILRVLAENSEVAAIFTSRS